MTENKIALVTGANKGIGFETSRHLARLGIRVLMGARDEKRGRVAVDKLFAEGLDVKGVRLDVTDSGQIAAVSETITRNYGRLDILVYS